MSPPRQIQDLKWAQFCARPSVFGHQRASGKRAQGLRYENLVAQAIPEARHGVWIDFEDKNGRGKCSPDLLLVRPDGLFVLECKLTANQEAEWQLRGLYLPVLDWIVAHRGHQCPKVVGMIVAKNLTPAIPRHRISGELHAAIKQAGRHEFPVLHWLGRGPI